LRGLDIKKNRLTRLPFCLQTLFERGELLCEGNPVCDLPKKHWFNDTKGDTL